MKSKLPAYIIITLVAIIIWQVNRQLPPLKWQMNRQVKQGSPGRAPGRWCNYRQVICQQKKMNIFIGMYTPGWYVKKFINDGVRLVLDF